MKNPLVWAGAGAAILVVLFGTSQRSSSRSLSGADARALAQMLLAETDFRLSQEEMAQIVWVALNRANARGVAPRKVVTPPGSPRTWNSGPVYRDRFNAAAGKPELPQVIDFVRRVALTGRNYGFTSFVHPKGMPTPTGGTCENANHTPMQTQAGARCIPTWAASGTDIGITRFA